MESLGNPYSENTKEETLLNFKNEIATPDSIRSQARNDKNSLRSLQ
jgi:hypothetical protein